VLKGSDVIANNRERLFVKENWKTNTGGGPVYEAGHACWFVIGMLEAGTDAGPKTGGRDGGAK
jgi:hypothetical protein